MVSPATAMAPISRHALSAGWSTASIMRFVSAAEFTIIDSTGCRASSTSRTPRSPACSAIARSIEALRPHASSIGSFKNAQPLETMTCSAPSSAAISTTFLKYASVRVRASFPRAAIFHGLGLFCSGQSPTIRTPYRCDSSRTCSIESYPWQSTYRCIAPVQSSQHV